MKECNTCNIEKTLEDFYNDKTTKDGKTRSCKECITAYRDKNKEKNKLYQRELRKLNNEKVKETRNKSYRNTDPRRKMLQQMRGRARVRGIQFNLELSDISIPDMCPYLKVPFVIGTKGNYEYTHSVDRIDNSKGYIPGNIEVVTKKANSMKNSATDKELINFALEIISRYKDNDIVRATLKNVESRDKEL